MDPVSGVNNWGIPRKTDEATVALQEIPRRSSRAELRYCFARNFANSFIEWDAFKINNNFWYANLNLEKLIWYDRKLIEK